MEAELRESVTHDLISFHMSTPTVTLPFLMRISSNLDIVMIRIARHIG